MSPQSQTPTHMFITDLDGTLFTDEKKISTEDWNALTHLGEKGVMRVVATGRSGFSFFRAMAALGYCTPSTPLPVDYLIFSTGAGIMDLPGRAILKESALTTADIDEIIACFDARQMDYMIHGPVPHTRKFLYKSHGGHNPDFEARIALYRDFGRPLNPCSRASFFNRATEVLAIVPEKESYGIARRTARELSRFSVIKATSPLDHASVWIEVFPQTVSKSKTAAWLARRLGIPRENILSVGNDFNDLDLLEWSGRGVVVDNAPASIKQNFRVVASNNHNGVARAAEKMLCLQAPSPLLPPGRIPEKI